MRHSRRGRHGGLEFGGTGEDSFVAVVVTKLTGALLFILLLTMVIMALIPRAEVAPASNGPSLELKITTPQRLPEAIAGRPYTVALAAQGGRGLLSWTLEGDLPKGMGFDAKTACINGTPTLATGSPISLLATVDDGASSDRQSLILAVHAPIHESRATVHAGRYWPMTWRQWLEQGFGFVVLALVWLWGIQTVGAVERWSHAAQPATAHSVALRWRFRIYRALVSLAAVAAATALAIWMHAAIG